MPRRKTLAETFPALQSPDFRNLWIGQVISAAGSQMQFAALNWLIYDLTGSPLALGGIGLVRVIPIVLVFTHRRHRCRRLRPAQTAFHHAKYFGGRCRMFWGLLVAFSSAASVPLIYLLTAIGAAAIAFDNPARQASGSVAGSA